MKIDFGMSSMIRNADVWMEESKYVFEIHIREDRGNDARCRMGRAEAEQMIQALQRFIDKGPD